MESTKNILGERVRQRCQEKGWSSRQLAVQIGIRPQSLHAIEHGKAWPSVPTLIALAEVLDCSLDWLCGLTNQQNIPHSAHE
ncbi:hypothetical protein BXT84_00900 [Sulfobacillus thermotolerans]|uniref:HTH cro/C1-type domain-containing protein n=1 Tax=Sulfobacillus thermotolerans TaxID=338644 RepID=A0ABN5GYD5_9FIRM|nr:hypothetical protein BXT84_00900 [Sulfobacillus thermotolerans]